MTAQPTAQSDGSLRGVTVGDSEISDVQAAGNLFYRGYNIHDLADHATFEEVVYLLWYGDLPTHSQLDAFRADLSAHYALPEPVLALIETFPKTALSMDALRTAVSALGMYDADTGDNSREANLRKALRIQAQIATIVAANERVSQGLEPVAPRPDLSIAANFLYMLHGQEADPLYVKTIDVDLILHADHEI